MDDATVFQCMQATTPLSLETPGKSSGKDSGSGKMKRKSGVRAASGNGNANAESAGDGGVRGQSQRFVLLSFAYDAINLSNIEQFLLG